MRHAMGLAWDPFRWNAVNFDYILYFSKHTAVDKEVLS